MKFLRIGLFILVALLQLGAPVWMIWQREQTLRHGRVWKFRTAPVDPVDLVRGRYVALAFAAEERPDAESLTGRSGLYAILAVDDNGFATVQRVSEERS